MIHDEPFEQKPREWSRNGVCVIENPKPFASPIPEPFRAAAARAVRRFHE